MTRAELVRHGFAVLGRPPAAVLPGMTDDDVRRAASAELQTVAVGDTSIRRAYGNWTKPGLKSWAAVLHENAIRPMQQYDYSSGKNASDMAMVIDAMALLYTDRPDAFAIVSSDADFTPLVMHLREKGAAVYGFGEQKTPGALQDRLLPLRGSQSRPEGTAQAAAAPGRRGRPHEGCAGQGGQERLGPGPGRAPSGRQQVDL